MINSSLFALSMNSHIDNLRSFFVNLPFLIACLFFEETFEKINRLNKIFYKKIFSI